MPPAAVLINTSPDLNFGATPVAALPSSGSGKRTLLLAPPSIASREDRLTSLFAIYPRSSTDLQMLDRLAAGLVNLPEATYDLILVVTDPNGGRRSEAAAYLASRAVWAKLVPALKAGATLRSEDGSLGQGSSTEEKEAVLAGLMVKGDGDGFTKVDYEEEAVPLRFGLKKKIATGPASAPAAPTSAAVQKPVTATPAGVGFIDFSDDLDLDLDAEEDDDDLVDEDMLLTEADMRRPIQQPPECAPQPGKKRRACKDCTCGLAERLQAEDKARQEKAENARNTLKLKSEDLSELDFTVKGKTGSCNGCYLGDAFRCEGCPYIGLPAFKPGEEVTILKGLSQI